MAEADFDKYRDIYKSPGIFQDKLLELTGGMAYKVRKRAGDTDEKHSERKLQAVKHILSEVLKVIEQEFNFNLEEFGFGLGFILNADESSLLELVDKAILLFRQSEQDAQSFPIDAPSKEFAEVKMKALKYGSAANVLNTIKENLTRSQ